MSATLDSQQFKASDLFEIKIPLNSPYYNDSKSFERYDGSIEINGLHYNYVERKVDNDTLILVCVPNKAQNILSEAKDKYGINDGSFQMPSGKANTSLMLSFLIGVCNHQNISYQFFCLGNDSKLHRIFNINVSCTAFHLSPEQPPEAI